MKIAVVVGQNPAFPLSRNLAGLWRAGRFFPRGRTIVEVLEDAGAVEPTVGVLVPNSLREGHVERRPDPLRMSSAAFYELTNDERIEVELLDDLEAA